VAETIVRSLEYGINLTEKMFERCPVRMDVVRLNCDADDSGWYEWMLMRWSSDPEASRRPDVDQLVCRQPLSTVFAYDRSLPQGIHASVVAFQFVHDVKIVDPLSVAIDGSDVAVLSALLTNLTLE
jgi:hypothetical protein